jgi:polyhydroxybutyrate depolymerase
MTRLGMATAIAILALIASGGAADAASGGLDPSFGTAGKVTTSSAATSDMAAQLVGVDDVDPAALVEAICESPRESLVRYADLDLDGLDEAVATAVCADEELDVSGVFVEAPEFPALVGTLRGFNVEVADGLPLEAVEPTRASPPSVLLTTYALVDGHIEQLEQRIVGFAEYMTSLLTSPIDRDLDAVLDPGILRVIRTYGVFVPSSYDPATPAPLLIGLHGFGSDGSFHETHVFKFAALADQLGWIYVLPNGLSGEDDKRFWNATDACCNFQDVPVDDVAFIRSIIIEVSGTYNVDPDRVYVVGHSNGGFMAHRLGCDLADRVTAIVSIAGAQWHDPQDCQPTDRVGVLEIHSNTDECISYLGGALPCLDGPPTEPPYPSARQTVHEWATLNGCQAKLIPTGHRYDLDGSLFGNETRVERFRRCRGGPVELWTIEGAIHTFLNHGLDWPEAIFDFLMGVRA